MVNKAVQWFVPGLVLCAVAAVGFALHPRDGQAGVREAPQASAQVAALEGAAEPIRPIPLGISLDARKVALGERLFQDRRLSRDNTVACASCHDLAKGGTDQKSRSVGIGGAVGDINAPTVFNSAFNFVQFWDGRAATLDDQIDGPVQNSKEMGSNWRDVLAKLRQDPTYAAAFERIYEDGIQHATVKDAIATFERSLITPNARFDKFLRGDADAITEEEKAGYALFKAYGCTACHQGVNVGGNMFQKIGVIEDYFADRDVTEPDFGRFNVTARERDRYVFKVPSLRNVALTGPYFHDGSVDTLKGAVIIMARYQLGRRLSKEELRRIVAFLKTLTGEYGGTPL